MGQSGIKDGQVQEQARHRQEKRSEKQDHHNFREHSRCAFFHDCSPSFSS